MTENKKIALVTGGSRGLGKDMALSLAKKGINVVLTYNSKKDEANEVVAEINAIGQKAVALQLNTADITGFTAFSEQFTSELKNTFGTEKFDFLVHNAGIGLNTPLGQTTEKQFDALVDIHFKGVFFLTQQLLPFMNDGGGIVNISSGLARFSSPGRSIYGSLKSAVETLSRYMAQELGSRRIRVNTVAPGPIATDFGGGVVRDNEQVNKHLSSITALGRVGLADDVGSVVAFLCTEDAKWINGQRIEVAGGINL